MRSSTKRADKFTVRYDRKAEKLHFCADGRFAVVCVCCGLLIALILWRVIH